MSDTHLDNLLLFETTGGGFSSEDFLVRTLRGVESLSTPYEFRLRLECLVDGGLAPEAVDEMMAGTCSVGFGPGGMQRVSGVLRQIELIDIEGTGRSPSTTPCSSLASGSPR